MATKLNVLSSSNKLWPDIPYKCPDVMEQRAPSGRQSTRGSNLSGRSVSGRSKDATSFDEPTLCGNDLAFLQFTSGSTSEPKGVMVTFDNIEHNVNFITSTTEQASE